MKPNFLGIGAQKSGTTWLHYMISQHPDIYLPSEQKELHFFDHRKNYIHNKDAYLRFFSHAKKEKAVGEITPGYLWCDNKVADSYAMPEERIHTPHRAKEFLGEDLKLLVLLRDPVYRAISAFFHHLKRGRITVNDNILDVKRMGVIDMGFYSHHLDSWLSHFEFDNFHIKTFEYMKGNKEEYLSSVFSFLGVDSDFKPSHQDKKYQLSSQYYKGEDGSIYLVTKDKDVEIITPRDINHLKEIYYNDVRALKEKFDVDTSLWMM